MSAIDSDQILTTPMLELSNTVDEVEEDAEVVFDIDDLSVSYGDKLALRDVSMKIRKNQVTAFIGPSGCGKSTLIRCLNRMNDGIATFGRQHPLPRPGHVRAGDRRHRRPPADRHGVPAAEPVPQVDLRQRRLRPARPGHEGRHEGASRADAQARCAVGRGARPPEGERQWAVRRPAAAAVHRPRDRRRPRGRAARRAVLGARPDLDRGHRGSDHDLKKDYTIVIVTHNMQQAARIADHTAFFSVETGTDGRRSGVLVEFDRTSRMFTKPSDPRTEGYVTGRFG